MRKEPAADVSPALNFIDRLLANAPLSKWQRTCLRQAGVYLRASDQHESYLTPKEVARRFNVATVTVRQWAARGKIEAITTPGGHRRFPIANVERFARQHRC